MRLIDIEPEIKRLRLDIEYLHSIANELRGTEQEICCAQDIVKTKSKIQWLKSLPIIDPESLRPTAHWIVTKTNVCGINRYECSSCGAVRYRASELHLNYCQDCGKRMVKADD